MEMFWILQRKNFLMANRKIMIRKSQTHSTVRCCQKKIEHDDLCRKNSKLKKKDRKMSFTSLIKLHVGKLESNRETIVFLTNFNVINFIRIMCVTWSKTKFWWQLIFVLFCLPKSRLPSDQLFVLNKTISFVALIKRQAKNYHQKDFTMFYS